MLYSVFQRKSVHVLNNAVCSSSQVANVFDFLLEIGIEISCSISNLPGCLCLFSHMQFITLPRVAWFLNGSQEVSEWEGTLGF